MFYGANLGDQSEAFRGASSFYSQPIGQPGARLTSWSRPSTVGKLSPEEISATYSPKQALALNGRELTRGEIGCSLSHLRLYQRQIDLGHEEVVILEDDVVVDPRLLEILDRRDALPADWELVLFHRLDTQVSTGGADRSIERHRCVKFAASPTAHKAIYCAEAVREAASPRLPRSRPGRSFDWR